MIDLVSLGFGLAVTIESALGVFHPGVNYRPIGAPVEPIAFHAVWRGANDSEELTRFLETARALAEFLVARVRGDREDDAAGRAGLLIATVNGIAVAESAMARALLDAGFVAGAMGFNVRRVAPALAGSGAR